MAGCDLWYIYVSMTPSAIADALKHWREVLGLSQRALAERTGLSHVHIARLELAQSDPRLSTLVALAESLEISLVDLLTEPKASRPARKRARGKWRMRRGSQSVSVKQLQRSDEVSSSVPMRRDAGRMRPGAGGIGEHLGIAPKGSGTEKSSVPMGWPSESTRPGGRKWRKPDT